MLKFLNFRQTHRDYCGLSKRIVEAIFDGDLHTLRKLVAYDFVEFVLLDGQLSGRDGFLQHAMALRENYRNLKPTILSCEYTSHTVGDRPNELYKSKVRLARSAFRQQ